MTYVKKFPEVIFFAAKHGYIELIDYLAANGINFNLIESSKGITPVYAAAELGQYKIIERMARAGANLSYLVGDTSIAYTAAANGYTKVIEALAEHGADFNCPNKEGWTPVHIATQKGHVEILKVLSKYGADFTGVTVEGMDVVYIAAQGGQLEALKELAKLPINLNLFNPINSWTPALIAAQNGHSHIINFLAKNGVSINLPKSDGWTPALIAAINGHIHVLKVLAKQGVDLTKPAPCGYTPMAVAIDCEQNETVDFLKNHKRSRTHTFFRSQMYHEKEKRDELLKKSLLALTLPELTYICSS